MSKTTPNSASNLSSNLTGVVETKFLSLIDKEEAIATQQESALSSANYLKLADLYLFHKDFKKEAEILTRFSDNIFADSQELVDVYERIERNSKIQHQQSLSAENFKKVSELESSNKNASLSLLAIESEDDNVVLKPKAKVVHQHKDSKRSLKNQMIRVLAVCAVYTDRSDLGEILELSLVLFEYSESNEQSFKIIQSYTGNRDLIKAIPKKTMMKFGIDESAAAHSPMNPETILPMFLKADYVVSHNNPEVERKKIVTLFPEVKDVKWYSTYKDIPWRALGINSIGLSDLAKLFGKRKPRSSLDRAKMISYILQFNEPNTNKPYIERIHYMKPMKAIEWTSDMEAFSQLMSGKTSKKKWILVGSIFGIISLAALISYLSFY